VVVKVNTYEGSVSDGNLEYVVVALFEVDADDLKFIAIAVPIIFEPVQDVLLVQYVRQFNNFFLSVNLVYLYLTMFHDPLKIGIVPCQRVHNLLGFV
jgi:hypothetical protein